MRCYLPLSFSLFGLLIVSCESEKDSSPVQESIADKTVFIISQQPVRVNFEEAEDTLYFQFDVDRPGVIELSTEGEASGIRLSLRETSQSNYTISNELFQPDQLIAYGPVDTGRYQLILDDLLSSNSATQFTLKYLLNVSDTHEYNNTLDKATLVDTTQSYQAYLHTGYDVDYYAFDVDQIETVEIEIPAIPRGIGGMILEVFDESNTNAPISRAEAVAGEELQITTELFNSGRHYLKISATTSDIEARGRIEPYQLILSFVKWQPLVPYVTVDTVIDLDALIYESLQTDRGYVEIEGGYRGIIVYRENADTYRAFERASPHRVDEACAVVTVDKSGLFMREGCDNSIYDFQGNPSGGLAQFPLKKYSTRLEDNLLYIFN